ncbi:MAG: class II glutamine amidotransferase [Elusimicrobia bacterium]|nr:class II glutamine amidotransferase [Elusimicrobiota bacterium]
MCRLFAQIAPRAEGARDLLVDADFSLLRQAHGDPANPQKDGWGLAWFGTDGKPRVTKSGGDAAKEADRFKKAADSAVSPVVLGHLRAASNPHLDDSHAHPFEDEGWVFIHNGTLTIADEVKGALGERKGRVKTNSDSEVYFQQFMKHLKACGDPSKAFELCIEEDWRLWADCRAKYPDASTPYTALNAIASDGKGLHALCHASRKGLAACGIFHRDQPWGVMSFAVRGDRVAFASEGVDGGEWTRLNPPETISAVPKGSGVQVTRRALTLKSPLGPVPEVTRS